MKIYVSKDNYTVYTLGDLYKFNLEIYKSAPYPFISEKNIKTDTDYKPILASVNTYNFIIGEKMEDMK